MTNPEVDSMTDGRAEVRVVGLAPMLAALETLIDEAARLAGVPSELLKGPSSAGALGARRE